MPVFRYPSAPAVLTSPEARQRRGRYQQLCQSERSIPLFARAFWLDAVCGPSGWDVALVESAQGVEAALPYHLRKESGATVVKMPQLTQTAGPWLRAPSARYSKRLAQEKDLFSSLIEQLEAQSGFDRFGQNFHHGITNWLPFYWHGYAQTTRYTYVIDQLQDLDAVWQNVQANIRTDVRKAEGRNGLRVRAVDDTAELLHLTKLTFARQGLQLPYTSAFVERLDQACREHSCRRIFVATDAQGRNHAAVHLVWDDNAAYYLISGADPELRNSGAQSFLVWEAIRFAATVSRSFDFEGSMLEPVERFVRAFGARQVPFFRISKTSSPVLEARATVGHLVDLAREHWPRRAKAE